MTARKRGGGVSLATKLKIIETLKQPGVKQVHAATQFGVTQAFVSVLWTNRESVLQQEANDRTGKSVKRKRDVHQGPPWTIPRVTLYLG